jgi:enoyl-[acyl-carrier-protein] reductase (NADH)
MWLGFGADYRAAVGVEAATPLEQAYPLVFLCSAAAGALTGQIVITDSGYFASGLTETFPDATPAVNFLLGRY